MKDMERETSQNRGKSYLYSRGAYFVMIPVGVILWALFYIPVPGKHTWQRVTYVLVPRFAMAPTELFKSDLTAITPRS
jgi:hypothetical protein